MTRVSAILIFDRGSNFNAEVVSAIKNFGIQSKRTSFRSPWQYGVVERWVGNCHCDLLDHFDRAQRTASESTNERVRPLLPG